MYIEPPAQQQRRQLYIIRRKRHKSYPLDYFSMEEKKGGMEMSISAGGGAPSSSRWNPTKEQISFLEGLYMQGIRTPSADQIQQITSKLKAYGHIEGKNVFYWFQNHKARQRQKEKQESLLYFNRFLHKATPILPPPPPAYTNVLCSPYFIPNSTVGFYPQCSKVPLPGGSPRRNRRSTTEKKAGENTKKNGCDGYEYYLNPVAETTHDEDDGSGGRETLQLFPLQPTGILEDRRGNASTAATATKVTCNDDLSFSSDEQRGPEKELFNFFAGERP